MAGTLPLHEALLLVSGRVSFELVQKAAMAGIPVLLAFGAPIDTWPWTRPKHSA